MEVSPLYQPRQTGVVREKMENFSSKSESKIIEGRISVILFFVSLSRVLFSMIFMSRLRLVKVFLGGQTA